MDKRMNCRKGGSMSSRCNRRRAMIVGAALLTGVIALLVFERLPVGLGAVGAQNPQESPGHALGLVGEDGADSAVNFDMRTVVAPVGGSKKSGARRVRILEDESGLPVAGCEVGLVRMRRPEIEMHSPAGRIRKGLMESWSRILVRSDEATIGVPLPLCAISLDWRGMEKDFNEAGQWEKTGGDGVAACGDSGDLGGDFLLAVARHGRAMAARLVNQSEPVTVLRLPLTAEEVVELRGHSGDMRPDRLLAIDRRSATLTVFSAGGPNEFRGPPCKNWIPFLQPQSGYCAIEPLIISEARRIQEGRNVLRVARCRVIAVEGLDSGRAIDRVVAIAIEPHNFSATSVFDSVAVDGLHYLPCSDVKCHFLIMAAGHVSAWCDKDSSRCRMRHGEDPVVAISALESNDGDIVDLTLCPPDAVSGNGVGSPLFDPAVLKDGHCQIQVPEGRYVFSPGSGRLTGKVASVLLGAPNHVVLEGGLDMLVRSSFPGPLVAVDRIGKTVIAAPRDGAYLFCGLSGGPVCVGPGQEDGVHSIFVLSKSNLEFVYDGTMDARSLDSQAIYLSIGWSVPGLPGASGTALIPRSEPSSFLHVSGARANCAWHTGDKTVFLPQEFKRFEIVPPASEVGEDAGRCVVIHGRLAVGVRGECKGSAWEYDLPICVGGLAYLERGPNRGYLFGSEGGGQIAFERSATLVDTYVESIFVAPSSGGAHCFIASAWPEGCFIDHVLASSAVRWNARVPRRSDGWLVVSASDAGVVVDSLSQVLSRGFVRIP